MSQSNQDTNYSIAELAKEFDITTRTIRFYEDKQRLNLLDVASNACIHELTARGLN